MIWKGANQNFRSKNIFDNQKIKIIQVIHRKMLKVFVLACLVLLAFGHEGHHDHDHGHEDATNAKGLAKEKVTNKVEMVI